GGEEPGRKLPVCRAWYNGGWHPGKVVENACNCGHGGREIRARHYQVLSGQATFKWVRKCDLPTGHISPKRGYTVCARGSWQRANQSPSTAHHATWFPFKGGQESCGTPLVLASANYGRYGIHPGKIVSGRCNFGYGGREVSEPHDYWVLLVRGQCE
ncbi:MAG: DM9 repeat-containing protein, partial [Bacteroidota bacterium]